MEGKELEREKVPSANAYFACFSSYFISVNPALGFFIAQTTLVDNPVVLT